MSKMRAAVWYNRKDIRIEDRKVKKVQNGQVKIKVAWTGICGTDLHEYESGPHFIDKGHLNRDSENKNTVVLGHEISGTIVELGEDVTELDIGDKVIVNPIILKNKYDSKIDRYFDFRSYGVFTDGGLADYLVTKKENVVSIPKNTPLDKAALSEPLSVASQAIKSANLKKGDTVAVIGCGTIGLLTIAAAKAVGAKIIFAFDISEARVKRAQKIGATFALNSKEVDPLKWIHSKTSIGVDVTFEAAGTKETFYQSIQTTRPYGHVAVIASYVEDFSFNPSKSLLMSGVTLSSPLGFEPQVFKHVATTIADMEIDSIITKRIELAQLVEEGFKSLSNDNTQSKILVKLSGEI